jgi:hypothetical protein
MMRVAPARPIWFSHFLNRRLAVGYVQKILPLWLDAGLNRRIAAAVQCCQDVLPAVLPEYLRVSAQFSPHE